MPDVNKNAEAEAIVQTEREAVRRGIAEVADLQEKLDLARASLAQKQASLNTAEKLVALFSNTDTTDSNKDLKPKRRMRLGSKKRVVYELVSKEVGNLKQLEKHLTVLSNLDITKTYIRDVVRVAIENQDMQGELDRSFIITPQGREILEKAPKPSDWGAYKQAAEMRHELPTALPQHVSALPIREHWEKNGG